jgi:hypothetical protein
MPFSASDSEHVQHTASLADPEVVQQGAIRGNRLRPDPRAVPHEVRRPQVGHQAAQGRRECATAGRAAQLDNAHSPVLAREASEADVAQAFGGVARREAEPVVPLALQREDRIGAGLDTTPDHAREVRAEEREVRIGDRVDQVAYEPLPFRRQPEILAAERHDGQSRLDAAQPRDAVGLQSSAVDQSARADLADGGVEDEAHRVASHRDDPRAGAHDGAGPLDRTLQRFGHRTEVDDARLWHVERLHSPCVGLASAKLGLVEQLEPLETVDPAAALQRLEPDGLARRDRDDQLAADLVRHVVPLAEVDQLTTPLGAGARLERARPVVDAGVDHATVVAGLVRADPLLGLQHDQPLDAGPDECPGGRETDDPAADEGDVVPEAGWHGNRLAQ